MSITDIFPAKDIEAALASALAGNTFQFKTFFQMLGLPGKSANQAKKVFEILDRDQTGFIDELNVVHFLQNFNPGARDLNAAETKAFLKAGDSNGDGRIGLDEFQALVKA